MAPTLALVPVLGDGEVDLGKCGIRKENLGYFLSRVKKWGREAVSLQLGPTPRLLRNRPPPHPAPAAEHAAVPSRKSFVKVGRESRSIGCVGVGVVGWGCLGDRVWATTRRTLRHRLVQTTCFRVIAHP